MNLETLRAYMSTKQGAYEDFPFGPQAMVFKVMGKMFALLPVDESSKRINLKCDPELALHFRAAYDSVQPGYHMNKKHWNSIILDGSLPDSTLKTMIDDSYNLHFSLLPLFYKYCDDDR